MKVKCLKVVAGGADDSTNEFNKIKDMKRELNSISRMEKDISDMTADIIVL